MINHRFCTTDPSQQHRDCSYFTSLMCYEAILFCKLRGVLSTHSFWHCRVGVRGGRCKELKFETNLFGWCYLLCTELRKYLKLMEFQKAAEDTSSESRRSCLRFLQRFAWWSEITIGSIEVAGFTLKIQRLSLLGPTCAGTCAQLRGVLTSLTWSYPNAWHKLTLTREYIIYRNSIYCIHTW